RRWARRPVATTLQPAATNRRVAARPKPEVAPVMKTVLDIVDFLLGEACGFSHHHATVARRMPGPRLRRPGYGRSSTLMPGAAGRRRGGGAMGTGPRACRANPGCYAPCGITAP